MEEKEEYIKPDLEMFEFGTIDTVNDSGWGEPIFPS